MVCHSMQRLTPPPPPPALPPATHTNPTNEGMSRPHADPKQRAGGAQKRAGEWEMEAERETDNPVQTIEKVKVQKGETPPQKKKNHKFSFATRRRSGRAPGHPLGLGEDGGDGLTSGPWRSTAPSPSPDQSSRPACCLPRRVHVATSPPPTWSTGPSPRGVGVDLFAAPLARVLGRAGRCRGCHGRWGGRVPGGGERERV